MTNEEISKTIDFANSCYRLMYLIRYNIYPRNISENVANHIAQVSLLSLYLGDLLKAKGINVKMETVLSMSVTHDLSEINGMDIVHKVKEDYPELKELSEKIELIETEKLLGEKYKNLLIEFNEEKTLEAIIVKIADIISCIIYSNEELKLGNTYFNLVKKESEERLEVLQMKIDRFINTGDNK